MPDQNARREDVVLDLNWLDGVRQIATADLRKRRDECRDLESELSYARRLLQGKIDILSNEINRRSDGGDSDVEDLVRRLPAILAAERTAGGRGPQRLLQEELPANAGKYRRRRERLATELSKVASATREELTGMLEELQEEEKSVSSDRRRAQQIVDSVNAELVRRYKDGEEDPSALLAP